MFSLDNILVFVRVVELGSISSGGRDLLISPAVASHRIRELEKHLGVRLLNRTTRQVTPTEHGRVFYEDAKRVLEAVAEAQANLAARSEHPRGTIRVTAPLGFGRRFIASGIPDFRARYPDIEVRLRLSDHHVDMVKEGIDLAFRLGVIEDSSLQMRSILDCERVLVASPAYLHRHGSPHSPADLVAHAHQCLLLRFPGSPELHWTLRGADGPERIDAAGPFDSDDGDVLTDWALMGHGIALKPRFEVESHIRSGQLRPILTDTPPLPVQLAAVYPHRKFQDPKLRLFLEFMAARCQRMIREALDPAGDQVS